MTDLRDKFPSSVEDWGHVSFADALSRQLTYVERRAAGEIPDTLALCEHDAVFTLGRGTHSENLPAAGATPLVPVDRGGDITWHGPGQIVGYWFRLLPPGQRDLHAHLRRIEQNISEALRTFGLTGSRVAGKTGVWVDEFKVASIGIAVRRWVTYHGFSLNVQIDPRVYRSFRPCGLEGGVMTDLASLLDRPVELGETAAALTRVFAAG